LLIVGGGIGGLTAALALHRSGVEVQVLERAATLEEIQVGSGITVWAHQIAGFRDLGLADELLGAGAIVERLEYRTSSGRLIGGWDVGETARELDAKNVTAPRGSFHAVLAKALPDGVLQLRRECTGVEQNGDGVRAGFADGSSVAGDVLVGFDGFDSAIRAQLLGEEAPRVVGLASWNTIVEFQHPGAPQHLQALLFGAGARFLYVPVGNGQFAWIAAMRSEDGESISEDQPKRDLLERFGDWAPPVAEMIEASPESQVRPVLARDRPPAERWGEGRVTLAGDAAHPMTFFLGQGGCQAIQDGFALARAISERGPTAEALRAFEADRMEKTAWIVQTSNRMARSVRLKSPPALAIRSLVMRFAGPRLYRALLAHVR